MLGMVSTWAEVAQPYSARKKKAMATKVTHLTLNQEVRELAEIAAEQQGTTLTGLVSLLVERHMAGWVAQRKLEALECRVLSGLTTTQGQ